MRIGLFSEVYYPSIGGVATAITTLKRGLEELGHEVYIITTSYNDFRYCIEDNGHLIRLSGMKSNLYDFRITGPMHHKAFTYLKSLNLDVIHTQTEFGVGMFGKSVAKSLKIPLIHTFHTLYTDDAYLNYVLGGNFKPLTKKAIEKYIKLFCSKSINAITVPSEKTKEILENKYKIKRNIYVISNGIDLEKFNKSNFLESDINSLKKIYGISKNDFILLFAGRVADEKNIDFLIKNHTSIIKKNKHVKLLIAGGGPALDKLKDLVKTLKLEKNVIFTDRIDPKNMNRYYQLGNVFVTASTSETQGLTTVEALASSLPAFCINDDSFKTTVIPNYNGDLFIDNMDYIEKIINIVNNKKLLRQMVLNSRMSVDNYSAKGFASNMIKVYESCKKKR